LPTADWCWAYDA